MKKLSPHFSLEEFTFSLTAVSKKIDNTPNAMQIANIQALCENILEPIRNHFGIVKILSGFRSVALNGAINGQAYSQHMLGEAADIKVNDISNADLWHWIYDNLNYDQLIAEKLNKYHNGDGWVHVSYKSIGKQRKSALSFLGDRYVNGFEYVNQYEGLV